MTAPNGLHDLLFEVSNENRYSILLLLKKKELRLTDISRELKFNNPEARRHITRLRRAGLLEKNVEGFYSLTPYGEMVLILLQEFTFLTSKRDYLQSHTFSRLPTRFVRCIGDLSMGSYLGNVVDFFRNTENLLKESKESVWLLVDQFPLNSLSTIIKTIDRGVKLRVIEPKNVTLKPDLDALTLEENQAITRTKSTPLVEQRTVNKVNIYLVLSETRCIVAFPNTEGQYDYRGFSITDEAAINWCREIFLYYWDEAESFAPPVLVNVVRRTHMPTLTDSPLKLVLEGADDANIDAQAVQDAVDYFDEVILKGTFNFGTSTVQISRSVTIKGKGEGIPSTIIYKKGWIFPFTDFNSVFKIEGEDANVTIENIHFTDFNHTCIFGVQGESLNVKNNRITLMTGYGRGMAYGAFGDVVIGVWIRGAEHGGFKGPVSVNGNQIDFTRGGAFGGFLTRGGLEENPEYRPDLFNHEYYMGFGIAVQQAAGEVNLEKNVIQNANARGIAVTDSLSTAVVRIRKNFIESDLYGSYPFTSPEAGVGILVQSSWGFLSPSFNVEIVDNTIRLGKLNHCGIKALGAVINREGTGKLSGGLISNNQITLTNGNEGIHIRRCDDFVVSDNSLLGDVYYGIRISGRERSEKIDTRSCGNLVENNNMDTLKIRELDDYCINHTDGKMFPLIREEAVTTHIWLGKHSKNNVVKLKLGQSVLDEGHSNKVIYE